MPNLSLARDAAADELLGRDLLACGWRRAVGLVIEPASRARLQS